MAHYAYLDETNTVVAVIVGKDETELIDGLDTETYYAQGTSYTVKRTSYNAATNGFRYNYAGIGYIYDPIDDAFIPPMPLCGHEELTLNDLKRWECAACEAAFEQSSEPTA
jgi:hypothetical protein